MTSSTTQARGRLGRILALAALLVLMMASVASAATYTVTDTNDDNPADPSDCTPNAVSGDCSLREAIYQANASSDDDQINVPAGVYALTNDVDDPDNDADLDITADNGANPPVHSGGLTIIGNNARDTIIHSQATSGDRTIYSRIFDIEGGFNYDAEPATSGFQCAEMNAARADIRNLTMTRGMAVSDSGSGIQILDGGSNCAGDADPDYDGRLNLVDAAVTNGDAEDEGGGIYNEGELTLTRVLVANNTVREDHGAGIFSSDTLTAVNSTIAGNQAVNASSPESATGGGITTAAWDIEEDANGGDETAALTTLTNVTVAFNEAFRGGGLSRQGAGNSNTAAIFIRLRNTIVAHNRADLGSNCFGPAVIESRGFNLEDSDTCGLNGPGDKILTDAGLGPRSNNGGQTDTYPLVVGSPAIDAGTNDECPAEDQRLVTRPQGERCDIGAYEAIPPPPGPPPPPPTVIRETVLVPTAFPRVRPRGLTLRVRKDRPTRRSLRLRSSGRVLLPAGLTPAQACTFGTVAVQVKANGKTVSTRITQLTKTCRYSSRVTFNAMRRIRGRTLTVRARFFGNDRLRQRFSAKRSAGRA